jgi:hypothetical protein
MQGSLILIPSQEEDHIHKPVKWLLLQLDALSIGHVWDNSFVVWLDKKQKTTKFQCSKCKVGLFTDLGFCIYHKSKLLNLSSVTKWEWKHLPNWLSKLAQAVMLLMPSLKLVWDTNYPGWDFSSFSLVPLGQVHLSRSWLNPSTSFSLHHLLIILPFSVIVYAIDSIIK